MSRKILVIGLACTAFAARPKDYSADLALLDGGQVMQTMKLYVSGPKSRVESLAVGPLGRTIAISRKDRGVVWTLFPDKRQYTEKALQTGAAVGRVDLSNLDISAMKKEYLGRETVLGYPCAKLQVNLGKLPNGNPMTAIVWVADALDLPVRLSTMGFVQENRNIKVGTQPAHLFEIPAGFTKTGTPGMPSGTGVSPTGAALGRSVAEGVLGGMPWGGVRAAGKVEVPADQVALARDAGQRYGGKGTGLSGGLNGVRWKANVNLPGGDYKSIDMATGDPARCMVVCEKEKRCVAWTLVKPETSGGMGFCWLKDSVPEATREACCISGLKGAGSGGTAGTTAGSRYRAEMDINRFGEDYRDFIPSRADAELCAEACAKDGRCRAWTWVKAELEGPNGHCWLKSPAPGPTADSCCVSGLK